MTDLADLATVLEEADGVIKVWRRRTYEAEDALEKAMSRLPPEDTSYTDVVNNYLNDAWRSLRNGATEKDIGRFQGAVSALLLVKALSSTEHELWLRRITTCPGHDDEGGRSWCAYCGNLSE